MPASATAAASAAGKVFRGRSLNDEILGKLTEAHGVPAVSEIPARYQRDTSEIPAVCPPCRTGPSSRRHEIQMIAGSLSGILGKRSYALQLAGAPFPRPIAMAQATRPAAHHPSDLLPTASPTTCALRPEGFAKRRAARAPAAHQPSPYTPRPAARLATHTPRSERCRHGWGGWNRPPRAAGARAAHLGPARRSACAFHRARWLPTPSAINLQSICNQSAINVQSICTGGCQPLTHTHLPTTTVCTPSRRRCGGPR